MSANLRYLLVFFCVLLTVGADTFPAYNVKPREATPDGCLELAGALFGPDDYKITMHNGRYIALACDGRKRVECDTISGGVFGTDNCDSPDPADGAPNDIPTEEEAIKMGMELLTSLHMLPEEEGGVVIEPASTSNTFLAHEYEFGEGNYVRDDWKIDITVNLKVSIVVGDNTFMLTGGGGKFLVTYGSCGKPIVFQALWREICGEKMEEIPSREQAISEYIASLGPLGPNATVEAKLGYQSEPFGVCQEVMHPVWILEGEVVANGQKRFGHRIPTEGGPLASPRSNDDDDNCKLEVGMEYLGEPYGLGLASENAAGFRSGVMHTAPIGNVTYEKSNALVWGSDWTTDNKTYVESADLVWYTGHANSNGWMVTVPDTGAPTMARYTSFNQSGNGLGEQDLEWLIIAACGPHQDEAFENGAGSVFDRWRGIFHGLHIMFAYGSASSDSAEEGAKFMRYAQEGNSLIDAWFRAAKEVQPPGVVVTAMWADGARDDHLPGYGSVSEDSSSAPQEMWFMWTTT